MLWNNLRGNDFIRHIFLIFHFFVYIEFTLHIRFGFTKIHNWIRLGSNRFNFDRNSKFPQHFIRNHLQSNLLYYKLRIDFSKKKNNYVSQLVRMSELLLYIFYYRHRCENPIVFYTLYKTFIIVVVLLEPHNCCDYEKCLGLVGFLSSFLRK